MKKNVFFSVVVLAIMMLVCSCSTTDLSTNQVGVSTYIGTIAKDFEIVDVITLESTETVKVGFLSLTRSVTGSRITYSDLLKKAIELGADDVVNVRIDRKDNLKFSVFDVIFGSTNTYTYVATGTAIKYKDAKPDTPASNASSVEVKVSAPSSVLLDTLF